MIQPEQYHGEHSKKQPMIETYNEMAERCPFCQSDRLRASGFPNRGSVWCKECRQHFTPDEPPAEPVASVPADQEKSAAESMMEIDSLSRENVRLSDQLRVRTDKLNDALNWNDRAVTTFRMIADKVAGSDELLNEATKATNDSGTSAAILWLIEKRESRLTARVKELELELKVTLGVQQRGNVAAMEGLARQCEQAESERDTLKAENAELRKDKERGIDWLETHCGRMEFNPNNSTAVYTVSTEQGSYYGRTLRQAIDAATKEGK